MSKLIAIVLVAGCGGAGMGADTRADITKQMQLAQDPIQGCYASSLKQNRKLKGMVTIDVVAESKSGQFKNIIVRRDELGDPGVRDCIIAEVGKLKLAKPSDTNVSFSYPLRFAPTN